MSREPCIGANVPRVDAWAKATGAAQYTDDLSLPGMLHGALKRSPLPHARIRAIDTSRARALPGVKAVITAADLPRVRYGNWRFSPATQDEHAAGRGQGALRRRPGGGRGGGRPRHRHRGARPHPGRLRGAARPLRPRRRPGRGRAAHPRGDGRQHQRHPRDRLRRPGRGLRPRRLRARRRLPDAAGQPRLPRALLEPGAGGRSRPRHPVDQHPDALHRPVPARLGARPARERGARGQAVRRRRLRRQDGAALVGRVRRLPGAPLGQAGEVHADARRRALGGPAPPPDAPALARRFHQGRAARWPRS